MWATYNPANNRITADTNRTSNFGYDASGNTQNDGINNYWYDAEGQLCAVQLAIGGTITQYIYDAEGARIGKGTLSTAPATGALCAPLGASGSGLTSGQGFALSTRWLVDLGGQQVTELNSAGNWQHSNMFAGGKLTATYDYNGGHGGLHFELADPLGTKRVQANVSGVMDEYCLSLPFGNDLGNPLGANCTGTDDATEHHFTGKERDTESGNDYFEARYYSSAMGRFMSPDWSAKEEPVPYAKLDDPQTLNLYDYLRNNPLGGVDADGHDWMDALQYASGVAQGVESSLTGGLVGSPRASDSAASLSGQLTGSLAVTHISATALADSGIAAGGGLIAAPESGGTSLAVEPVAGAVALVSLATAAGGAKNVGAVALAMSAKKVSSPNQMNQEVKRGQAPKDVKRVDGPHTDDGGQGQNHVHLTDGSAQNQDGTAHHGTPSPSNAVKDWLKSHGW
jgi:RHS repeat-associated protein